MSTSAALPGSPSAPAGPAPALEREDPAAWRALWALALGFFMLLVDATIVSVTVPRIMADLGASVSSVIWVSSAYLLTYAVPLMITGRLGDRFGPKTVYLLGLAIFTATSLWCGLAPSIGVLIAARAAQGLGAALMSPQTMSVITRTFPPHRRGAPMGLWGATAGVASLVGPILGGFLADAASWRWIFFVNVPVGVVAFALAMRWVPSLDKHEHEWDWLGVLLNAAGLFLVVFGLQEGESNDWAPWVWACVVGGVLLLGAFAYWQKVNRREPLMPFSLFQGKNFAVANVGSFVMGAATISMSFPVMLWLQSARGLTPTQAALLTVPSAVASMVCAPLVGKLVDKRDPKPFIGTGFVLFALSLAAQWWILRTGGASVLWLLLPNLVMGIAGSMLWGPLASIATRDLEPRLAGAGSGVYNATRQLGSVLGSAAIAAVMEWQLVRHLPQGGGPGSHPGGGRLPELLQGAFSTAMANSLVLPIGAVALGLVAALFIRRR